MNPVIFQSLLRHVLGFAGGALVAKGYVDEASIEPIIGGVMTLGSFAWSLFDKRDRKY